jgi:hypothetical protein
MLAQSLIIGLRRLLKVAFIHHAQPHLDRQVAAKALYAAMEAEIAAYEVNVRSLDGEIEDISPGIRQGLTMFLDNARQAAAEELRTK